MSYNGHPSRNYWNVALWIANDEGLYRTALDCIKFTRNRKAAAQRFLEYIGGEGSKTPNGSPYTVASIMHGMRGLT